MKYEGSEKKQSGQKLEMMLKAIEVDKVEGAGGGGVFAQTSGRHCQFKYFGENRESDTKAEVLLRSKRENKVEQKEEVIDASFKT